VQKHTCLLGKIIDGEMMLNDAGKMVERWCAELSHKFSDIVLDTYMIMPNHFHGIIVNNNTGNLVGADLRVCPDEHSGNILGEHEQSYQHIANYIINNFTNWEHDKFYTKYK
jgi:hypothetical protein